MPTSDTPPESSERHGVVLTSDFIVVDTRTRLNDALRASFLALNIDYGPIQPELDAVDRWPLAVVIGTDED
jgi:hypothetical protein